MRARGIGRRGQWVGYNLAFDRVPLSFERGAPRPGGRCDAALA
jgi:hypothetical protein